MPRLRPLLWSAMLAAAVVVGCGGGKSGSSADATVVTDTPGSSTQPHTARRAGDWTRFGFDAARTNDAPRGIGASKVARLSEQRVRIDGTVDSSPIYFS